MVKDAEAYAEDDKRKIEEIKARNTADTAIFSMERTLRENGDKLDDNDKNEAQDAISNLKNALSDNDLEKIKSATDSLIHISFNFVEKLYKKASEEKETQKEQSQNESESQDIKDDSQPENQ